jgi:hypothetical protein
MNSKKSKIKNKEQYETQLNNENSRVKDESQQNELETPTAEETKIQVEKKIKFLQLPRPWIVLMTLRLLLNMIGQRSYIHPDEFFQGF